MKRILSYIKCKQWCASEKSPYCAAVLGVVACVLLIILIGFLIFPNACFDRSKYIFGREKTLDWTLVNVETKADLNIALRENDLFQNRAQLPDGYLWNGFANGCGDSEQEVKIIEALVNLRADVIPVVSMNNYYGTHRALAQKFEGNYIDVAHYLLFDREDLVARYQPASVVFDFYRKQIDEIPRRDEVLAEIIATAIYFNANGTDSYGLDADGNRLGSLSIALSNLKLDPYPNTCLILRDDMISVNLEEWIISFWARRSVEGNYDLAKQVIFELAHREMSDDPANRRDRDNGG